MKPDDPEGRTRARLTSPAAIQLAHEPPFTIAELAIDPPQRLIGNERVEPRVMQVLVALHRSNGEVLTRDDLASSCWDGLNVGDDAISRVIVKLRRTGEATCSFGVETLPRVGYRLCPAAGTQAAGAENVPPQPDGSVGAPLHERATTGRKARLPLKVLGGGAATLVIIALGGWLTASTSPALSVNLGRFEVVGQDLPQSLVASLDSELRTAFGETSVPVTTGDADLLVTGAVRRMDGARLRFSVRVNDAASGAMLWSGGSDRPIADGEAQRQFAAQTAGTIDCALDATTRHGKRMPARTMSLTFQACAEVAGYDSGRQMIAARRLVRDAPDFWLGWHLLAYAIGGLEMVSGGIRDPALAAEAAQAARRVIALQPDEAEGYTQLALALPPGQPAERERLLRRAVASNPEECACAIQMLGDFLMQVGRVREAASLYQRAVDQNRTIPLGLWRLAMGHYVRGQATAGDEVLRRAQAIGGKSPRTKTLAALWTGRWVDAARTLKAPRADEQAAFAEGLAALAAGDPARIASARKVVERLPARADSELLVVPILTALGGIDAAFERLDASRTRGGHYSAPGRMPGLSRPLLFDPMLKPLWHDPRVASFLERAGFMSYWRDSGSQPDLCSERDPPSFCAGLAPGRD